jgi:Asp-tRNA(Asn)/Glu-tRNA(Gln) amidotransferase A subunit family amidase
LAIPVPILDKSASVTSLQLVGAPLSEAELLNAGRLIEKATSFLVANGPEAEEASLLW